MALWALDPFWEKNWLDESLEGVSRGRGFRSIREDVKDILAPLDVFQEGDDIVVCFSIPGIKAENIGVTIEDGLLRIEGNSEVKQERKFLMHECRFGAFHRTLRLPDSVDSDKAESTYEDGVLTIIFPKLETKKAKRLEIKAA